MHPKTAFGKDKNTPQALAYACKDAVKGRNKVAHEKNRVANNERHAALRADRKKSPDAKLWAIKKLLDDARRRARQRNLEFSISTGDFDASALCPIFGVELIYQANEVRSPNSASLDRIDSGKGYIQGNIWIISWRANQIKSDATPDELRAIADALDVRLGKRAAGALLDGREWREMPNG